MTTSSLISLHQCFIVCHTVAEHDQINNGIDYLKHKNYVYYIIFTISLHDLCIYLYTTVSKNMAQKQVIFIFQLSKNNRNLWCFHLIRDHSKLISATVPHFCLLIVAGRKSDVSQPCLIIWQSATDNPGWQLYPQRNIKTVLFSIIFLYGLNE